MASEQGGSEEPRFNVGSGFWGKPLASPSHDDDVPLASDKKPELGEVPELAEVSEPAAALEPVKMPESAAALADTPEPPDVPGSTVALESEDEPGTGERNLAESLMSDVPDVSHEGAPLFERVPDVQVVPPIGDGPVTNGEPGASDEPGADDESKANGEPEADDEPQDERLEATIFGEEPAGAVAANEESNVYERADEGLTPEGRRGRLIAVGVAVAVALVVAYGMGVRRFSTRFLPNTSIQGYDVSGLTEAEAEASLAADTSTYACEVGVGDFALAIEGTELGVERDEARIAHEARVQQSPYAWPLRLLFPADLTVSQDVQFDEDALAAQVVEAVEAYNEDVLPSNDASIDFSESTGTYELAGSVTGTALDADVVLEAARGSVRGFFATCEPAEDEALRPATLEDLPSFAHAVEWANRARTTDVPILVNGETVITSEAWQNAEWVTIVDGPAVSVDYDAVYAWGEYSVADAVYHRDDWNDYYLDLEAFAEGLCNRLATGVVDGYEAPTYDVLRREGESRALAYERGGWNSELGRYIDVDLEAQFARLFDDKGEVIWESAFVSGNMYEAHSTVTGVFSIYSMDRGVTLVGLDYDNDGKPDYESYVDYWMPFYGGYGLHDATWRYNFGGTLYYYDGSHGCINLPYKKAEELYGMTFVGETVNVHW